MLDFSARKVGASFDAVDTGKSFGANGGSARIRSFLNTIFSALVYGVVCLLDWVMYQDLGACLMRKLHRLFQKMELLPCIS